MPKLRTIETRLAAVLRWAFVQRGDHLFYGSPELMVVAGGAAITLGMLNALVAFG